MPKLKVFGKITKQRWHSNKKIISKMIFMDLAHGPTSMIKNEKFKKGLEIYNFGTGKGYSILDVIKAFEKNIGISIL